ncbi:uncharacterized protein LOC142103671 isoform X2 [Mixophyes fleayi]|uniref:uncharacterized protein LOC142103671 isoform X2 n=1 Tax=Mixophyes fleayi TaxID=3061075 RepID=UPI003F4DBD6A
MNTQQETRRIRLSETRTSWEDQGTSEVAAGKLEVMEKFFTPLSHSTGRRAAKSRPKEEASWERIRDKYYKESISTSSPSTSSSPWSSESNFGVRARFSGYHAQATHSRSCNDLSAARGRGNEVKRDFAIKQKDASLTKKNNRDGSERLSPGIYKAGSNKKSHSGHVRDVVPNSKSEKEDKRILKHGARRAKSMEALAEKETRKRQGNDRRVTEEKQRFSRFLDEITIQVLSPSSLNSLGVKERQSVSNREQWKNSSTDSSGSRGNRSQHHSQVEQQEVRRKGRTVSATRTKVSVETPGPRRSRDMSTSPDSVSSSTWHRGEREDTNLTASALSHQPRRTSHRLSQERDMKGGNLFEQIGMEKNQILSGGGVLKGKTHYSDKVQNRKKDTFSETQSNLLIKDTDLLSSVSSLLHHLPADMLESVKITQQGPDGRIQLEDTQDFKSSSVISPESSHLDVCSGNLKYTREESKVVEQPAPQMTAFTPWSPRRQRSFPALHTLYTSTESECSLEEMLPTFRLLPPRFPNLGESFSDDRKDDGNSDGYETRTERKTSGDSKSSLPLPSLLPIHRIPHHNHHSRVSSSESSGDDQLINWGEIPSQEPPLDYISAQKILDTLLGLTASTDRTNILNPENVGEFSFGYVPNSCDHLLRSDIQPSNNPKDVIPRNDSKHMSNVVMKKNEVYSSEKPSQPKNSLCSVHSPLHNPADDSKIPLLPARGCSFSGSFANACPLLSPVGEVGFRPVGKNESSSQHKFDGSIPQSHLPTPVIPPTHHSIPFVLRSPSGSESIMGSWDSHNHCQEGAREKKPRKARTVTFNTINNGSQANQGQITVRSKFMSNRDQGQGDNPSVDSTLL